MHPKEYLDYILCRGHALSDGVNICWSEGYFGLRTSGGHEEGRPEVFGVVFGVQSDLVDVDVVDIEVDLKEACSRMSDCPGEVR